MTVFKYLILTLTLSFAVNSAFADTVSPQPLSDVEYRAALNDLQKRSDMRDFQWPQFQPQSTTKQNISRLLNDPRFKNEPTKLHGAAIAVAANTQLLRFETPSDIIAKMSQWFPHDIQDLKSIFEANIPYLSRDTTIKVKDPLELSGPYQFWDDDSTAFLTLWNCMPQTAWLRPDFDPSNPILAAHNNALSGLVNKGNSSYDADFGYCLENYNTTEQQMWAILGPNERLVTEAEGEIEYKKMMTIRHKTAIRVKSILSKRLPQWINALHCTGTGPDDCLLLLDIWGVVAPHDPEITAIIKKLDQNKEYLKGYKGSTKLSRTLAFNSLKLKAINANPELWTSAAYAESVHQISKIANQFDFVSLHKNGIYFSDITGSGHTDPWLIAIHAAVEHRQFRAPLFQAIRSLDSCSLKSLWLDYDVSLKRLYIFDVFDKGISEPCLHPSKSELNDLSFSTSQWSVQSLSVGEAKGEIADEVRAKFDQLADTSPSKDVRTYLLSYMIGTSGQCSPDDSKESEWSRNFCMNHRYNPLITPFKIAGTNLELTNATKFRKYYLQKTSDDNDTDKVTDREFIQALSLNTDDRVALSIKQYIASTKLTEITIWRKETNSQAIVKLHGNNDENFYLISPHSFEKVQLPYEWFIASNVGHPRHVEDISDLDNDGNLEVWLEDDDNDCHNNDSDLERDLNCHSKTAQMGELDGNMLGFFKNNKDNPVKTIEHNSGDSTHKIVLPDNKYLIRNDEGRCNKTIINQVLSKALPNYFKSIDPDFEDDTSEYEDGFSIQCKTHPVDPSLTIITFFYPTDDAGTDQSNRSNDSAEVNNFVVAVIDLKNGIIKNLFEDTIEDDAEICVECGFLSIDTARYNITSKMRAFGIRMHISHSSRYAEAGEGDYLSLFIEDGKKLKRILNAYPMEKWEIVSQEPNCMDSDNGCDVRSSRYFISIAPTITNGWHDLILSEKIGVNVDLSDPNKTGEIKHGDDIVLKMKNGLYQ